MNETVTNEPELAVMVRRADPDRFLGALFAPRPARRWLLVLYAFNHELARAREVASAPPLALIRLHWWREVVEGAAREQPLARLLRQGIETEAFDPAELAALVDAREVEAAPIADIAGFLAYARGSSGGLARIAGRVLGVADAAVLAALEDIGTGYAIAGILRAAPALRAVGRDLLPQDGTDPAVLAGIAESLLRRRVPRIAVPAALPGVLARRDLARLRRGDWRAGRGMGDRLAAIAAGLRGRA